MSANKSNADHPMVFVVPPETVRVLANGDTVADPGVWYGQVGAVRYYATISRASIEAGPAWTPEQELPLTIDRAAELACAALARLVRNQEQWTLSEVTLQRLRDANPERWFYVVGFACETGRRSQQGAILIPVTFSGKVGAIKKAAQS